MDILATDSITHLRRLVMQSGNRLIGTPGNRAAADYIAAVFRQAGMTVDYQEIACPDWREESIHLECGGEIFEAYTNTFSPSCAVAAPILPVCSLAELEGADCAGQILLFYGDLAAAPVWTKAFFFTPDRDRRIIQILEERRPAAVLTINLTPGARWRMIEDSELDIPSATVQMAVGQKLLERAGQPAILNIRTRSIASSTANIVGRLTGQGPGRIVLCAHYDAKHDTPGAWDNASGVAVLLSLSELYSRRSDRPALEFVAFTREEYYTSPEDDPYYQNGRASFGEILAAINIDGVAHALSTNSVAVFAASTQFEKLVEEACARRPAVVRVDPWPASNHHLFFSNGVPSLAFSSVGPANLAHTPADTVDGIDPRKLAEVTGLIDSLIQDLAGKSLDWTRPLA